MYVDAQIYGTILYGIVCTFMPVARAYVVSANGIEGKCTHENRIPAIQKELDLIGNFKKCLLERFLKVSLEF